MVLLKLFKEDEKIYENYIIEIKSISFKCISGIAYVIF